MRANSQVFLAGISPPVQPLGRFIPPLPDGIMRQWLQENVPQGSWILDPFTASPRQTVEAARAGYRVIAAANNPIGRFLLEMHADPPGEAELKSALSQLAGARVGDQRIELYIQSLYVTECDACDTQIEVEAFIWNQGESVPSARLYDCPNCGHAGEYPANRADVDRARAVAATISLHQSRALERVAAINDPDRQHAEEALEMYLPRAVLALFTLINKADGLQLPQPQKNYLDALLLSACDRANSLWIAGGSRPRPKQLTLPTRFYEYNIWKALENAITHWSQPAPAVLLIDWDGNLPEIEPGTLVLFDGPLRELSTHLREIDIKGVIAPLPRPNQAFWTLSALWAGWLWGREAVGPFKSVLRRRRYDWGWHTTALHAAFSNLAAGLRSATPCFGLIGESEPGFLTAALFSARAAHFHLDGIALRSQINACQITWTLAQPARDEAETPPAEMLATISRSSLEFLNERGEPAGYDGVHAAALCALVEAGLPAAADAISQGYSTTALNNLFLEGLSFRAGFARLGGTPNALDTGLWWLKTPNPSQIPLADRCEMEVVSYLARQRKVTEAELDEIACQALPGLYTPDPALLAAITDSYAQRMDGNPDVLELRPEDEPARRRQDLEEMRRLLAGIASELGYSSEGEQPVVWKRASGELAYIFYLQASANISKQIYGCEFPASQCIIVLPGGRANLVMYKQRRDPYLAQAVLAGWRFLKFRHVLQIAENPLVTTQNFAEQLELDPLTYSTSQMRLF
jgi:hypothetical protein